MEMNISKPAICGSMALMTIEMCQNLSTSLDHTHVQCKCRQPSQACRCQTCSAQFTHNYLPKYFNRHNDNNTTSCRDRCLTRQITLCCCHLQQH